VENHIGAIWYFIHDYNLQCPISKGLSRHHYYRITTGGWSGYRSQRLPGMPTLIHGLRQFKSILLKWKLAQTLLVCTHLVYGGEVRFA
jgi:hypothetical protein